VLGLGLGSGLGIGLGCVENADLQIRIFWRSDAYTSRYLNNNKNKNTSDRHNICHPGVGLFRRGLKYRCIQGASITVPSAQERFNAL